MPSPDEQHAARLSLLRTFLLGMVRDDYPDLSSRQLAMFMVIMLEPGPHTVSGIAVVLRLAKPTVTRAADRLEWHGVIVRERGTRDRRSVLLIPTEKGEHLLQRLTAAIAGYSISDLVTAPPATKRRAAAA